jgi:hypothetical protein
MEGYHLIFSAVHGNALGVVIEPRGVETLTKQDRVKTWQVRIGPLVEEAAIGSDYPEDEFDAVVNDLKKFCDQQGVGTRGL